MPKVSKRAQKSSQNGKKTPKIPDFLQNNSKFLKMTRFQNPLKTFFLFGCLNSDSNANGYFVRRGSLCCNNNDSSQKHLEDWWWKFYKRERERERESSTVTRCVHKARERKGFDRQEVNCPKFKSIQSSTIWMVVL